MVPQVARNEIEHCLLLADALIRAQRAVTGVEAEDLVRPAQLVEAHDVVVDLADGTAWIVLAGQDHDPGTDVVGERDRRAIRIDLRILVGCRAEEGAVIGLQWIHLVLEGGDVIGHRHARDAERPQMRLEPKPEQGQVAAP